MSTSIENASEHTYDQNQPNTHNMVKLRDTEEERWRGAEDEACKQNDQVTWAIKAVGAMKIPSEI